MIRIRNLEKVFPSNRGPVLAVKGIDLDVAEGEFWAKDSAAPSNKKMLNEAVKYVTFSPFHPRWREIEEKYLSPQLDLVFNGKKSAADAMREIAPQMNAVLQSKET